MGAGLSSPIIAKGRVFLTEFDRATKQLATLCIDQRTGKILWRRTVAPAEIEKVHEIGSPAAPTPATDGERVYVYFGSYGLVSYDFDGKLLWERRLPLPQNIYGAVASPIVAGDLLVLNHQGKDAYLLGVNRRDGKTVWKTDRSKFQYGWSTPVYWRHDGIDEIVVLGGDFGPNQRLMAYNLADGAERWWVAGLPPCGKSTPVIGSDMVFFAAPDIILDVEAEKKNPERAAQIYFCHPVGLPLREMRCSRYSSPVAADNKIYLASEEGVVVVLDGGEELKVLARNKLDGQILATPAIVDGKIYVRTENHLYAFGR